MSAPLKPSYRDLSICLGMRYGGGGAEAAAGARQCLSIQLHPPMPAPLKPSYRDLSICLGMRYGGGGAEAAAGARQRQKCSQMRARKPQRDKEEGNQGVYQDGVDGFCWHLWQCPTWRHSEPAHHDARMSLCVLIGRVFSNT